MHLDNSSKLNLERNLQKTRRKNNEKNDRQDYETSENDNRPIVDPELEFMADKSGMIHVRKHVGENEVLPGYGTTNFGVSAYETKRLITGSSIAGVAGLATAGLLLWKFKSDIGSKLGVIANYALLLRESYRS